MIWEFVAQRFRDAVGSRETAHLTRLYREPCLKGPYLVSGNGVPGEVYEKVIVRGKHRTGVLLQHHVKGFPDGCAVLVPGQGHKFIEEKHCITMRLLYFHFSQSTPRTVLVIVPYLNFAQEAYKKDRTLSWLMA